MYVLEYRSSRTQPFQISADVFKRHVWQQTEYVMGGGATHFMFLVMAADRLFNK